MSAHWPTICTLPTQIVGVFMQKVSKPAHYFKRFPLSWGPINPPNLETSTRFTNANHLTSKTGCKPLGCHFHCRWFVMEGPNPSVENWNIALTQLHFSYISCPSFFALCWICHLHLIVLHSSSPLAIMHWDFARLYILLLKMHNIWMKG
jgi:hypothetical protein